MANLYKCPHCGNIIAILMTNTDISDNDIRLEKPEEDNGENDPNE